MELKQLAAADQPSYNDFVAKHPFGTFLQSWEWGDWYGRQARAARRFLVMDSGKVLLAGQAIISPVPKLGKSYLYLAYGPLLAPEQSALRNKEVVDFFIAELQKLFPVAPFIRIEPANPLPVSGRQTVHIQTGKTLLVDLRQSEEELLANMHQKTRYNIKVAAKHGVAVQSTPVDREHSGDLAEDVVELIERTARRQHYKSHGIQHYRNLVKFFAGQVAADCRLTVYRASYQNELLVGALMIDFGTTRTYLFGGTSYNHRNVMAPYLLHLSALLEAKARGLQFYDFWGVETATGKTPGFVRFKLGWGGFAKSYPPAVDLVQQPLWYTAYTILRWINRKT